MVDAKKEFCLPFEFTQAFARQTLYIGDNAQARRGDGGGDIFSTKRSKAHTYHDLDNLTKGNFSNGNREMNI